MSETRRVEAKKLPVDVYNSMKMIIDHTGESQSDFINRAIRAEVERRGWEVRKQMASQQMQRIQDERFQKESRRYGSREAQLRQARRVGQELYQVERDSRRARQ